MLNLLIFSDGTTEHYYCAGGIHMRKKEQGGIWSASECLCDNATGTFWVYSDSPGTANLIYTDKDNNLCYAHRRNDSLKRYILSGLNPEITPVNMQIYPISGRMNMLYSAKYKDDYILIHCILGNHAQPHTVNKLTSAHFWIYKNAVYYTDKNGALGYTDLTDEKPDVFNKISDFGDNVSVYDVFGEDTLLFTHENRLYINHKEIIYDSRMEMPALTLSSDAVYVMWKSGGYARYITSLNRTKSWSPPMRFMTSGAEIQRYYAQSAGDNHLFYGYNSPYDLHLFANPDIF